MDFVLDLSLVRADHAERQRQAAVAHRAAAAASSPPARPWRWVGRRYRFTRAGAQQAASAVALIRAGSQPMSSPAALSPALSQSERE